MDRGTTCRWTLDSSLNAASAPEREKHREGQSVPVQERVSLLQTT